MKPGLWQSKGPERELVPEDFWKFKTGRQFRLTDPSEDQTLALLSEI